MHASECLFHMKLSSQFCIFIRNKIFIALIHPIQWTIALPVGATGPAKRQKKKSPVYNTDRTGQ